MFGWKKIKFLAFTSWIYLLICLIISVYYCLCYVKVPGCCKVDRNFNFSTPYSLKRLKRWIPLYPFQKNCLDEKRSNSWLYVMNLSFTAYLHYFLCLRKLRCIFGLLFQLCLRTTRKWWRLTQNLVWVTRGFWEWQPPLGPCRSRPHYPNRRLRWPQAGLLESALPWTRWGHWQRTSLEARDQPASLMMLRQGSGSRLG